MKAVVDYAQRFSGIDPERMAVYGISGGGYIVPRAVTGERRFAACATCSIILDFSKIWSPQIAAIEHSSLFKLWRDDNDQSLGKLRLY